MRSCPTVVLLSIVLAVVVPDGVLGEEASMLSAGAEKWQKCPADMVPADTFCIDKYEYPNKPAAAVRSFVTYLEAVQLCAAQGKRLCTTDEWSRACSGPKKWRYPYGDDFIEGACNLAKVEVTHFWRWYGLRETKRSVFAGQPATSGTLALCVSAYGAHDMVGNFWEWTDSGVAEYAILMGGCWATPADKVSCITKNEKAVKYYQVPSVSFRCCCDFLPKPSSIADVQESSE